MPKPQRTHKVIDCRASDHQYLHKDFHGALCYGIKYITETFGPQAVTAYLQQVARTFYAPLIEQLKQRGLPALQEHWKQIFTAEGGDFELTCDESTLVLTVNRCPAVCHIKENGQLYTEKFCETTVVVNETICADAGYRCSCDYQPGQGACVQKFWKE